MHGNHQNWKGNKGVPRGAPRATHGGCLATPASTALFLPFVPPLLPYSIPLFTSASSSLPAPPQLRSPQPWNTPELARSFLRLPSSTLSSAASCFPRLSKYQCPPPLHAVLHHHHRTPLSFLFFFPFFPSVVSSSPRSLSHSTLHTTLPSLSSTPLSSLPYHFPIFFSNPFFLLPPRFSSLSFRSAPEPGARIHALSSSIRSLSLSLFEHRSSHLLHSRDSPLLPREELTLPALARRPWPEFYRPTVCTYYQQPSASFTRPKDPVKRLRTRTEEHRHVFLFLRTQRRSLRGRKGHSPVFRTRNG